MILYRQQLNINNIFGCVKVYQCFFLFMLLSIPNLMFYNSTYNNNKLDCWNFFTLAVRISTSCSSFRSCISSISRQRLYSFFNPIQRTTPLPFLSQRAVFAMLKSTNEAASNLPNRSEAMLISEKSNQQHSTKTASNSKSLVLVIAGPTAVGKSLVAAKLCDQLKGMIVSADSIQAYKGVQIGANKPDSDELSRMPHLLIDVVDNTDSVYSAAEWRRDALFAIETLVLPNNKNGNSTKGENEDDETEGKQAKFSCIEQFDSEYRNNNDEKYSMISASALCGRQVRGYDTNESIVPVVVGGTMMYLQWLVHGRPDAVQPTEHARELAQTIVQNYSTNSDWDGMVQLVRSKGEIYSNRVDKLGVNDWYRIRRILEMAFTMEDQTTTNHSNSTTTSSSLQQNEIYSGIRENSLASFGYDVRCFFLCPTDRWEHAKIVDKRCEDMVSRGLIEETANLIQTGTMSDMVSKAIGYRQTIDYLNRENPKENDYDAFLEYMTTFTAATRQYSKRQMQWFRRDKEFVFVPVQVDIPCAEQRIQPTVNEILRLISLPRIEYEREIYSDTCTSAVTRKLNEKQGKDMKRYQFALECLKSNSHELVNILEKADLSTQRISAKRSKIEVRQP